MSPDATPGVPADAELPDGRSNLLLRALPDAEYARVREHLEPVDMDVEQAVHEEGAPIEDVYFPLDSVVSLVALVDGQTAVEIATIGREGMAGLPFFLGAATSPNRSFCQVPGRALRMSADDLREVLVGDYALHDLLHRYTQAMLVQVGQNAACNQLHSAEERCARWLLQTQDRVGRDQFPLTQEFLSQMLGVRRATVTVSAGALQGEGLIRYTRGSITVLDRAGLEDAACDCYRLVSREYAKLERDARG